MLQNAHVRADVFEAEGIAIITNYHEQKAIVLSFCFCLLFSTICWQTNGKKNRWLLNQSSFYGLFAIVLSASPARRSIDKYRRH